MLLLLLCAEVQEMELNMPRTCQINFDDPHKLHSFFLTITPDEGYWLGGRFKFCVDVPEEYNILVCCLLTYLSDGVLPQPSSLSGNTVVSSLRRSSV